MVRGLNAWGVCRRDGGDGIDLDVLLHPGQAFEHPMDVVEDPDLTLSEKRSILASWASDACAIEAAPELRRRPGGRPVPFDDIMDALAVLDGREGRAADSAIDRGRKSRWRLRRRSGEPNDGAQGLYG
jgi:hypothetical protein